MDGSLSPPSVTSVGAGTAPNFIAFDPTGQYAYVGDRGPTALGSTPGSTVSQYTVGAAGALAPNSVAATVPSGLGPSGIATAKHY